MNVVNVVLDINLNVLMVLKIKNGDELNILS